MRSLLSSVPFASLLVYSPRGRSEVSRHSRRVRDAVKQGRLDVLEDAAARAQALLGSKGLDAFLGPDVVLVPAPRSSPLTKGALWPAERICQVLSQHGLGRDVIPSLRRTVAVPKSAFARSGERPDAQRHYDTMAVEPILLLRTARMTVVDDVITKGATLLAGASRLAEAWPDADVRTFALLRTMGLIPDIDRVVDPCVGVIVAHGDDAEREP